MDKRFLEQINELLDSSERNFFSDISDIVRERFLDSNEKEIEEFKKYVDEFVECCTGYGSRIANDCKTPYMPRDDSGKRTIEKYIAECRKEYPEIEEKHIRDIFFTVCWLTNR